MSKCKSVMDGQKITKIAVKAKGQECPPKDAPKPKGLGKSK